MSYYNLFLDDERFPKDVKWVELPPVEWVIMRSHDDFVKFIEKAGLPARVSFDHDLADEHYAEYVWAHHEGNFNRGKFRYDAMKEKTGYESAKWLVDYCAKRDLDFPEYYVHTMNPIGKDNIISYIENYKRFRQKKLDDKGNPV